MNKAPIKAIKKETASLLVVSFFIALIGAYTIDLLSQDNVVSKRKKRIVRKFIRLETVKHLSAR